MQFAGRGGSGAVIENPAGNDIEVVAVVVVGRSAQRRKIRISNKKLERGKAES